MRFDSYIYSVVLTVSMVLNVVKIYITITIYGSVDSVCVCVCVHRVKYNRNFPFYDSIFDWMSAANF